MERKTRKKLAAVLVFFMLFSILPTAVFAAPAEQNQGIELQPYTSMEDLMQKATAELVASGAVAEEITASQDLVQAVEAQTGKSFGEVEATITTELLTNYEEGVIDTAAYGLDKSVMQDMMDYVLQHSYLTNDVTYSYNAQTDKIQFAVSESKAAALDGWNAMLKTIANNTGLQRAAVDSAAEAVAEVSESPKMSIFPMAEEESAGGHLDSCTTPSGLLFKDGSITTVNFHWEADDEIVAEAGSENGMLVYDSATDGIKADNRMEWSWKCTGADYVCPSCGEKITVSAEDVITQNMELWVNTVTGEQIVVNKSSNESSPTGQEYMLYMKFKMAILPIPVYMEDGTTLTDENGKPVFAMSDPQGYEGNDSMLNAIQGYQQMTALIKGKSECFGISTPYWTSKATEGNPFGALKVVLNMEEDDPDVPAVFAMYIPDLTKGFAALVLHYEDALLAIAQGAQDLMNRDDVQALTDEYKLLLLHDWLANNAVFDMGSLVASREEGHGGAVGLESLLGMTPFTMLSTAIGYNGGVCLGYTASYAYIVQNAFAENYYKDSTNMKDLTDNGSKDTDTYEEVLENPTHMVDFVKIRFHSNVAESSVAGPDSGWGDDAWFNEPHFFNAVQLNNAVAGKGNWFYVDPCYDDASSEVISQYRVETDGNISHMYFLAAPSTIQDQFEGNCDYIDSLYDGGIYQLPDGLTAEEYKKQVEDGTREAGWTFVETGEVGYTDTTYEEAWFSNAQSEIILHEGNWYYVEGLNAYNSMKDMMDDMGEYMEQFQDQFQQQQSDPQYAHELKRRPVSKNSNLTGTVMSSLKVFGEPLSWMRETFG